MIGDYLALLNLVVWLVVLFLAVKSKTKHVWIWRITYFELFLASAIALALVLNL